MRRLRALLACLFLAGLLFAAYALLALFVLHGPVTGRSLFRSVQDVSGSTGGIFGDDGPCRDGGRAREWRCDVDDGGGSSEVTYRVRVRRGSSCWSGRLTSPPGGEPMPSHIDGCVRRWQR